MLRKLKLAQVLPVCPVLILVGLLSVRGTSAQDKVDLEVKVHTASSSVRGGESIAYTATVSNIGATNATDVILLNDPESLVTIRSGASGNGICEIDGERYQTRLRCRLGDLSPGDTSTIVIEAKIGDFGDASQPQLKFGSKFGISGAIYPGPVNAPSSSDAKFNDSTVLENGDSIGMLWLSSAEVDSDEANNRSDIRIDVQPSKNIPPRIEVLSPKESAVFVRPLGSRSQLLIEIKAHDIDGDIRKVTVNNTYTPSLFYLENDGSFKVLIGGRKYTKGEAVRIEMEQWESLLEQAKAGTLKEPENIASPVGKGTYRYVLNEYGYGENTLRVCAHDDGGRSECTSARFRIKSDSEVKFVDSLPKVVAPDTEIVLETASTVRSGINAKVKLYGLDGNGSYNDDSPLMLQGIKSGTTIAHRYVWRPTKDGSYYLRARLYENGEFTDSEDATGVIVARPRVIRITSFKNGQECTANDPCNIEAYARDSRGAVINDRLEILVDGKIFGSIHSSDCEGCFPVSFPLSSRRLQKGSHTVQIVAKFENLGIEPGIELGRSEIYTVILK